MRTTLTLDDRLARALKDLAHRRNRPFKEIVNETLRRGLAAGESRSRGKRYSLPVYAMGEAASGLDLDKALAVAAALEDEEWARKLAANK